MSRQYYDDEYDEEGRNYDVGYSRPRMPWSRQERPQPSAAPTRRFGWFSLQGLLGAVFSFNAVVPLALAGAVGLYFVGGTCPHCGSLVVRYKESRRATRLWERTRGPRMAWACRNGACGHKFTKRQLPFDLPWDKGGSGGASALSDAELSALDDSNYKLPTLMGVKPFSPPRKPGVPSLGVTLGNELANAHPDENYRNMQIGMLKNQVPPSHFAGDVSRGAKSNWQFWLR